MLHILDEGRPLCDGLTRREWLRVGGVGLGGLSLAALLSSQVRAASRKPRGKAKSVILFGLVGGPPQHETWDPKPNAPAEVRSSFGTSPPPTAWGLSETFSRHAQKAMDLLHSTAARRAFDLSAEPDATRDRHGRSRFARSILPARRLVEAVVSLVQVNCRKAVAAIFIN